jgi:hypothetical protein
MYLGDSAATGMLSADVLVGVVKRCLPAVRGTCDVAEGSRAEPALPAPSAGWTALYSYGAIDSEQHQRVTSDAKVELCIWDSNLDASPGRGCLPTQTSACWYRQTRDTIHAHRHNCHRRVTICHT